MTGADFSRYLAPLARRVRGLVSRAVVRVADDTALMQALQLRLLAGETADGVERFQEYGFTSRPLAGSEAIALAVGGSRGHLVAVAVDDRRHRKHDMASGEVAVYTDEGDVIHLQRGRIIEVKAGNKLHIIAPAIVADCDTAEVNASQSVTLDTPATTLTGNLTVQGSIAATGEVTGKGVALSTHTHPGDSGGTTGVPK